MRDTPKRIPAHVVRAKHWFSRVGVCSNCGRTIYTDLAGGWRHQDDEIICCDESERTQADPR